MAIGTGDEVDGVHLRLEGFEGPLDLLLELARRREVDLARISITAMVDQFVATVAAIPRRDLPGITDWLVMAIWLTWLTSRLLLPKDFAEAKRGKQAGQVLIDCLAKLDQVRTVMQWLDERPPVHLAQSRRGEHACCRSPPYGAEPPTTSEPQPTNSACGLGGSGRCCVNSRRAETTWRRWSPATPGPGPPGSRHPSRRSSPMRSSTATCKSRRWPSCSARR